MPSKQPMKEFVLSLLKTRLPKFYYYHNEAHTLYVMDKVVEIAGHEKCTEEEIELLSIGALWHDSGYISVYEGHEAAGCLLVQQHLPEYGYSPVDIHAICGMIMATKIPQSPQNKLEEIIADADLEYLGTDMAAEKANLFFKELHKLDPLLTREEWNQRQISFLQDHHYFTWFCRQYRGPVKQEYLNKLVKASQ